MQVHHGVHLRVLEVFTSLRAHGLDFLARVAEGAGEDGVGEGFEAFGALEVVPGAYFFLWRGWLEGVVEGGAGEEGEVERWDKKGREGGRTKCLSAGHVPTGRG